MRLWQSRMCATFTSVVTPSRMTVVEPATEVAPAEGERQRASGALGIGQHFIGDVAIDLQRAAEVGKRRFGVYPVGQRRAIARDQSVRRRCLYHAIRAAAAGIFGSPRHDHAQPGRDLVEALGDVLADDVQSAAAARACLRLGLDHDLLPRQMRRQVAAIGAPAFVPSRLMIVVGLLGSRVLGAERVSTSSRASSSAPRRCAPSCGRSGRGAAPRRCDRAARSAR